MSVEIDTRELNRRLAQFAKFVPEGAAVVVEDEARLLCMAAIRNTPPRTKKQGTNAVARDIRRTMTSVGPDTGPSGGRIRSAWLQRALDNGGSISEFNAYNRAKGAFKGNAAQFTRSQHQSQRDRQGRVFKSAAKEYMVTQSDRSRLEKYIKAKQGNVGMFKAAWAYYVLKFGGRVPKWIKENTDKARRMRKTEYIRLKGTQRPEILIGVDSHPLWLHAVKNAVRVRERSLLRKINLTLKGATNRINTGGRYTVRSARR